MRALFVARAAMLTAVCGVTAYVGSGPATTSAGADPGRPPQRLADTGLYASDRPHAVDPRNRRFAPQYPLWSDGLTKKRWVYLPSGSTIDATNEHEWDFPVGTRFWKEFSLDGRRIETRLLWKASPADWVFASYAWNEAGTEAVLAAEEGVPGVAEVAAGRRHSIPSAADCRACHGTRRAGPLGFNALQLSTDRDPNAIHGEPLGPDAVTLQTLVSERLLSPARLDLVRRPPRIRTNSAATRAILGYLSTNCGACHDGGDEIAALMPSLRHEDVLDGDAAVQRLIGQPSKWQVPGAADGASMLVRPGAPEQSALLLRMRSRAPSSQMPPLGTVVRDRDAVDAVARWIAGDLVRSR